MRTVVLWAFVAAIWLQALSVEGLTARYPAWQYVLWEFELDESYIEQKGFLNFASKRRFALTKLYNRVAKQKDYLVRYIRGELLQNDMSDLFLYMSIVESALRYDALSSKKAKGIWQFMPATARRYKLRCDAQEDKRSDPVASTEAAIAYLYDLHDRFGKWYLAVMAYNCGEGCLMRAIARAGTDDAAIIERYVPKETRDYLRSVVLLAMIAESKYIASYAETSSVKSKKTVPTCDPSGTLSARYIRAGETFEQAARRLRVQANVLRCLNPTLFPPFKEDHILLVPEASDAKRGAKRK